jgi:hypothetical protein
VPLATAAMRNRMSASSRTGAGRADETIIVLSSDESEPTIVGCCCVAGDALRARGSAATTTGFL